jgi:4'-phosphopantetheinyl transferase
MPIDVPIAWSSPPSKLTLAGDEIHVWKAALIGPPLFADLLSSDEQARSKRFLLEKHRTRFTAGRTILRMILGSYLGVPPREIRVQYQPNGKPEIHSFTEPARLRFNLTHSGDLALLALTLDQEIGIDLEQVQQCPEALQGVSSARRDLPAIARRFFSRQEQDWLFAQPAEEREEAFFRIWTLKEAYLKAHGMGLAFPLDQFSVVPHLVVNEQLSFWTFKPEDGFLAALMLLGPEKTIVGSSFTLSPSSSR